MYKHLGNFVSRHWVAVILTWVIVAVAIHKYVAPPWDKVTRDGDLAYLPERMTSVRGEKLLAQAFPDKKAKSQIVLVAVREDGPLTQEDFATLEQLALKFGIRGQADDPEVQAHDEPVLKQLADPALPAAEQLWLQLSLQGEGGLPIVERWTPQSEIIGKKLISGDRQAALSVLALSSEFMAVQNIDVIRKITSALEETRRMPDFPAGLELGVSGSAAVGGDMMASAEESVRNTELATIGLVLIILMVVYRAPALVLIPLITIGLSVLVATDIVATLTTVHEIPGLEWVNLKVFKTTKIFVVTILFGAGTDFCLFLISRYREELERGRNRSEALAEALGLVGDAITASAATTIFGLSMLYFADFGKFSNSGPAIGLCLAVALLACLTLAPALLRAFGTVVFWPSKVGPPTNRGPLGVASVTKADSGGQFWDWASRVIIARPGLILVGSVLLLSPLAWQGWGVKIGYNLLAELNENRPSVLGTNLMHRHFGAGETGPITVLARKIRPEQPAFNTPEGEQEIARLTKLFYDIDGVQNVRSSTEPLGDKPPELDGRRLSTKEIASRRAILRNPRTKAAFLTQVLEIAGEVTRFDVVQKYDPFSAQAADVKMAIDERLTALANDPNSPWHKTEFDFIGTTAGTCDLKAVTESDQTLIQILVVLAVLGILIVLLRRPLICLYLIASVLFSYYVAIGTTELVFSHVYENFTGLDWKVPIFLFVILIAVGEDYNIYLVTRVVEEQKRWGLVEGLRVAVARTGGIITSCGVIMAGTFVSMMTGSLRAMLELGFALTLGVMLDTIVVRPVLVPAFLAILYRRQEKRAAAAPHAREIDEPALVGSGTLHSGLHLAERQERIAG